MKCFFCCFWVLPSKDWTININHDGTNESKDLDDKQSDKISVTVDTDRRLSTVVDVNPRN